MALKFNTELMNIADEFADFELLKPKAQPVPHFHTQETESMFILTLQLKGYTRTSIKIESNKDRSTITISGQKPVQDMLMVGGKVVKKDIEMRGFQKSFKVPKGVVFDQVNAMFNEDDSELVIRMPKVSKGLVGAQVEELKTEEIRTETTKLLTVYTKEELSDEVSVHDEKQKSSQRKFKICTPLVFGSTFVMSVIALVFHLVISKKQENTQKKKKQD